MKTFADCVAKVKTCGMGNYVSYSLEANDCSWYSTCEFNQLCADCSKPGPNCPDPATGGCPKYYPFESEVLKIGPPPIGTIGNGTCGPTNFGGNCNEDTHGAYDANALGIKSLSACVNYIRGKGCKMGKYVSYSAATSDCSWYSDCQMDELCEDCSQPGPNCPGGLAPGGHCPHYYPYESEYIGQPPPPVPTGPLTVAVDWSSELITTQTAATVEVDVMPFLGEADWGGPFESYERALSQLDSEFVRFSPWFANPRVVVPELTPHVCSATQPSTNWNSTYFDGVVKDFMEAVCGPDAANGTCTHSVVQQLSTMPEYMYVGGDAKPLPAYPWNTTDPFDAYKAGHALVDPTCKQMARYFGRLVGWYTAGGFTDECGHFHPSEFHYNWWGISVLNEDEHGPGAVVYTTCYDAIKVEVEKVNTKVTLVGPEIVGGAWSWRYMEYFLKAENHADKQAPPVASYHWFGGMIGNSTGEGFMTRWLHDYYDPNGIVQNIQKTIARTGQNTEVVLNEYIPFINE